MAHDIIYIVLQRELPRETPEKPLYGYEYHYLPFYKTDSGCKEVLIQLLRIA